MLSVNGRISCNASCIDDDIMALFPTQLRRGLLPSWGGHCHPSQVSFGLVHVLAHAEHFGNVFGLSSGWRRKFAEWKMIISH